MGLFSTPQGDAMLDLLVPKGGAITDAHVGTSIPGKAINTPPNPSYADIVKGSNSDTKTTALNMDSPSYSATTSSYASGCYEGDYGDLNNIVLSEIQVLEEDSSEESTKPERPDSGYGGQSDNSSSSGYHSDHCHGSVSDSQASAVQSDSGDDETESETIPHAAPRFDHQVTVVEGKTDCERDDEIDGQDTDGQNTVTDAHVLDSDIPVEKEESEEEEEEGEQEEEEEEEQEKEREEQTSEYENEGENSESDDGEVMTKFWDVETNVDTGKYSTAESDSEEDNAQAGSDEDICPPAVPARGKALPTMQVGTYPSKHYIGYSRQRAQTDTVDTWLSEFNWQEEASIHEAVTFSKGKPLVKKGYAFPRDLPTDIDDVVAFWELDFQVKQQIIPRMGAWEGLGIAPRRSHSAKDHQKYMSYKVLYLKWEHLNRSKDQWYRKYGWRSLHYVLTVRTSSTKLYPHQCEPLPFTQYQKSRIEKFSTNGYMELPKGSPIATCAALSRTISEESNASTASVEMVGLC